MNKFIKRTALTLITAFAVLSCAPDADITAYNFKDANVRFEADKDATRKFVLPVFDNYADPEPVVPVPPASNSWVNPKFKIEFHLQADIVRSKNIKGDLENFLSFHTYTNSATLDRTRGDFSTLSPAIEYDYIGTIGIDTVIVELKKTFDKTVDSQIIAKLSAPEYKYFNGLTRDKNQDGINGEAIYDDTYIDLSGKMTNGYNNVGTFHEPGDDSWSITIDIDPTITPTFASNAATTSNPIASITVATVNLNTINTVSAESKAINKTVADPFASGIIIQKSTDGKIWETAYTAEYDTTANNIQFKNVTLEHLTAYRIKYDGANISHETSSPYFGVNQRVAVLKTGETIGTGISKEEAYNRKTFAGEFIRPVNTGIFNNGGVAPGIVAYSYASSNRKAVIDLKTFSTSNTDEALGLEKLTKEQFNECFYIITSVLEGDDPTETRLNALNGHYQRIKVEEIEYLSSTDTHPGRFDIIRVTLDPNVDCTLDFNFLINDKFAYQVNASTAQRKFGNMDNILYDNFEFYSPAP